MPWRSLFEVDPDLLTSVPAEEQRVAQRASRVLVERVAPGVWDPSPLASQGWGLLVIEGMAAREVTVAGSAAAELLGAGDVIVTVTATQEELIRTEAAWTVLEALRVAVLDEHFTAIARRWPQVTAALLCRAARRADRIAVTQAISHLTRVDTRVLTMLWLLADRWGRVTPTGVVLPLRLTHRTMARLIGARRPSVTTALSELARRGLVSRRDDGSWALHGPPPEELERVGLDREITVAPAPAPSSTAAHRPPAPAPAIRHIADQIRRLAASYEQQQARSAAVGAESRRARAHAREVREAIRRDRFSRRAGRDAPPSA